MSDASVESVASSVSFESRKGVLLARKAMEVAEREGEAINELIRDAARVSAAGRGSSGGAAPAGRLDVYA